MLGFINGVANAAQIPEIKNERDRKEKQMNDLETDYKMSQNLSTLLTELDDLIKHNDKMVKMTNTLELTYEKEKLHFVTIKEKCEKQNIELREQINMLKNKIIEDEVYASKITKLTEERDNLNKKLAKLRKK